MEVIKYKKNLYSKFNIQNSKLFYDVWIIFLYVNIFKQL